MDAWEKFKKTVENNGLVKAHDRVLVAVSGGPDSISLLHLFWRLKKTVALEVVAVYLDHGLRRQSSREGKMVAGYGERFGLQTVVQKIPVAQHAGSRKLSLETAGRELRYRSFVELSQSFRCNRIATGHTANDNAETVLMWLMRGTGADGLGGIPLARPADKGITVIRPLLSVTRDEIMDYVRRQKLSYAVDASNDCLDFTRNKIRKRLIPSMKEYNPRIVEHLFSLSRIIGAENEFLKHRARAAARRTATVRPDKTVLDLKRFFRYNKLIQLRILKEVLPEKRSAVNIERLREWMFSPARKDMTLSRSWTLEKKNDTLVFKKRLSDA